MGQLVKLSDYVSRYEMDVYHYSSRFTRLKKERWQRLLYQWENKRRGHIIHDDVIKEEEYTNKKKTHFYSRITRWVTRRKKDDMMEIPLQKERVLNHGHYLPKLEEMNRDELKRMFKKEITSFQITWASSTGVEKSDVAIKYFHDTLLTYLLEELPDTFLIFYEPVFQLKNAPVELPLLILTPSELWLVSPLNGKKDTIFQMESERYWLKKQGENVERILHPAVHLKRMRTVIEMLFLENNLSLPIRTVVIAKDSYIDIPISQQRWKCIDQRNFLEWESIIRTKSPIKHQQLKIAEFLLSHCLKFGELRQSEDLDNFEIE